MNHRENSACGLVLPTYGETESISRLLLQLDVAIPSNWHFIIVDDSPTDQTARIVMETFKELKRNSMQLHFLKNPKKSGRGAAVQQGFNYALSAFKVHQLIEMDSDGSHTVESVLELIKLPQTHQFVVGSRYLSESRIIGWPLLRRIFSYAINKVLKIVFRIKLNDWTNGLRRYSVEAIEIQTNYNFLNKGFIGLSEQVLLLNQKGITPFEVPITFIERVHGKSTVTFTEIFNSAKGISGLYFHKGKWL
jgi:dolichol-phosphate mannosyltransferase